MRHLSLSKISDTPRTFKRTAGSAEQALVAKECIFEFAGDGQATRWFPVKRSKAIVLDPEMAFGKPVLTDYGVRTEIVADAFKVEKNKKTVASLFDIPVSAVEAAIRYERMAA